MRLKNINAKDIVPEDTIAAIAKSMSESLDNVTYKVLTQDMMYKQLEEDKMAERALFEVFQVKNGFFARMKNGEIVVANTLAGICEVAAAAAVEAVVLTETRP
jgi:hypothetical protein